MKPDHAGGIIPKERLDGVSGRATRSAPRRGVVKRETIDGVTDRAPPQGRDFRIDILQRDREEHDSLETMNFVALLPALIGVVLALASGAVWIVDLTR